MPTSEDRRSLSPDIDGARPLAAQSAAGILQDSTVHVVVDADSGHLVPGLRRTLVDPLLDTPETHDKEALPAPTRARMHDETE